MHLNLSRPADKSLEAYKKWLQNFFKAVTGKSMKATEEKWIKEWKEFWLDDEESEQKKTE
jgi:hypothetical protein